MGADAGETPYLLMAGPPPRDSARTRGQGRNPEGQAL